MKRNDFLVLGAAAVAADLLPLPAGAAILRDGARVQPHELFAGLPVARPGLWVRYILGFGVPYQKQIGFGVEETPLAKRYFIETQVGMPGGSCNPNTMKKAYLKTRVFGNLMYVYGVEAYVSRSSTMVMLDEDRPVPLHLLDGSHLYDKGTGTVTRLRSATMPVPKRAARQSQDSIVVAKSPVACTQCAARFDQALLKELEVWSAPDVPLGVGKIRARVAGMPEFHLAVDSYGYDFRTGIAASLDSVRAQQS